MADAGGGSGGKPYSSLGARGRGKGRRVRVREGHRNYRDDNGVGQHKGKAGRGQQREVETLWRDGT